MFLAIMKNLQKIICILFITFITTAVYAASPTKRDGYGVLCNPGTTVVTCNVDVTSAIWGEEPPDGEYYTMVLRTPGSDSCSMLLRDADFSESYDIDFCDGNYSQELLDALDAFTFQWNTGMYRTALIVTVKDLHIVKIHSDDKAWDAYARWVNKTFYGKDGYALIN